MNLFPTNRNVKSETLLIIHICVYCDLQESNLESAQIYFLASLSIPCYQLLLKVFDDYENCCVKGQKISRSKKGAEAIHKLDCRGTFFKCLRNLDEGIRQELLEKVVTKELSFQELCSTASRVKQLKEVQRMFMRSTAVTNWDEACQRYPSYTTTERLETLIGLNSSSPAFIQYVQAAKLSESSDDVFPHLLRIAHGTTSSCIAFIEKDPREIGVAEIRDTLSGASSFVGFQMCVTDISRAEEVRRFSFILLIMC